MHKKGTRKIEFDIDIGLHEIIKKLANECTPPISQGRAANTLLSLGIETYFEKAKKEGGENMPSNSVVINGNIHYEVPDSKMKAVEAVLDAVSSGAMGKPSEPVEEQAVAVGHECAETCDTCSDDPACGEG